MPRAFYLIDNLVDNLHTIQEFQRGVVNSTTELGAIIYPNYNPFDPSVPWAGEWYLASYEIKRLRKR